MAEWLWRVAQILNKTKNKQVQQISHGETRYVLLKSSSYKFANKAAAWVVRLPITSQFEAFSNLLTANPTPLKHSF